MNSIERQAQEAEAQRKISRWNYVEAPIRIMAITIFLISGRYAEAIFDWFVSATKQSVSLQKYNVLIKLMAVEGITLISVFIIYQMTVWRQRHPWDQKLVLLEKNRLEEEFLRKELRQRVAAVRETAFAVFRPKDTVPAELKAKLLDAMEKVDALAGEKITFQEASVFVEKCLVDVKASIDQELHRQKLRRRTNIIRYFFCIFHFLLVSGTFYWLYIIHKKHEWQWDGVLWGLNLPAIVIMFSWMGSTLSILWRTFQRQENSAIFSDELSHLLARPFLGVGMGIIAYLTLCVGLKGITGGLGEQSQPPGNLMTMLCSLVVGFYDKEWADLISKVWTRLNKFISGEIGHEEERRS